MRLNQRISVIQHSMLQRNKNAAEHNAAVPLIAADLLAKPEAIPPGPLTVRLGLDCHALGGIDVLGAMID